jgi:hypothetical protein
MNVIGNISNCLDHNNTSITGKQFKLLQCLVSLAIDLVPLLLLRVLVNRLLGNKHLLVHHLLHLVFLQTTQLRGLMMQPSSRLIRSNLLHNKSLISNLKRSTIPSQHLRVELSI